MSYRRLRVLLGGLPRTSRYGQATGGEAARWGDTEHLIATAIDLLIQLNHNFVQANSKQRLRPPRLMKRPGVELDEPGTKRYRGRARPFDELRKMTQRWRNGGGGDD